MPPKGKSKRTPTKGKGRGRKKAVVKRTSTDTERVHRIRNGCQRTPTDTNRLNPFDVRSPGVTDTLLMSVLLKKVMHCLIAVAFLGTPCISVTNIIFDSKYVKKLPQPSDYKSHEPRNKTFRGENPCERALVNLTILLLL